MAAHLIVLDNSINSRLLWPDNEKPENNRYALKVIQLAKKGTVFHVPTIWHYEAVQVAYKLTKTGQIAQSDAQLYFNQLALLPIMTDVQSHSNSFTASYALSLNYNVSIYDAAYLELALRLGAELASNDDALVKAAKKAGVLLSRR
ncbi:MAG: type II toxin-antitoxin system VapC family toxin [Pseudomonadales bacterium]